MSPEAITNIIFGIIMILLGSLEIILVERIVSRRRYVLDIERQMFLARLETPDAGDSNRSIIFPVELPADEIGSAETDAV